jgi:hypothetical protein
MMLSWLHEIRDHKWLAARALVVGWIVLFVVRVMVLRLVDLDDWLFVRGVIDIRPWWPDARNPIPHFLIGAGSHAAVGWTVGHFHREHRIPMVLIFFISLLLILDLPRFVPAAMASFGNGGFWVIVALDFMFLRLPIVVAGIWGVRGRRVEPPAAAIA